MGELQQKVITNILTRQRFQLLWSIRYPYRERHLSIDNRHLQNTFHLDHLSGPGLGKVQVAPDRWLRFTRVFHLPLQRYRTTTTEVSTDG